MTIIELFEDPKIFGAFENIRRSPGTWDNWKIVLKALFGLPISAGELDSFHRFAGGRHPPRRPLRESYLIVGRRGGKSLISALVGVYLAVFKKWDLGAERGHVMILARDREQSQNVFQYVKALLELPAFVGLVKSELKESILLRNNIELGIHTCNFKALRGYAVCGAVLDEAAFYSDEAGANPASEIVTALRPSLSQIDESLLLCISSPFSKSGILYDAHQKYFGVDNERVLVWQAPTIEMNPAYPKREINLAFERDPARARAEFGAEFRVDLETFISSEILDSVIVPQRYELAKIADTKYTAFVDPSGGRGDSMTLSISHKEGDKIIQDLVRIYRPPFSPDEAVKEFSEVLHSYGLTLAHGDKYAAEWVSERFKKHGVEYKNAELTKSEIYLNFLPYVMTGRCELIESQQLKRELRELERRTGAGRDIVDHPRGKHDDLANAAAGSVVFAGRGGPEGALLVSEFDAYGEFEGTKSPEELYEDFRADRLSQSLRAAKKDAGQKLKVITMADLEKLKMGGEL